MKTSHHPEITLSKLLSYLAYLTSKSVKPFVSIIIPTYNRAHLVSETLKSVLGQTYNNWECIVVEDGSSDNTEKVIKTYLEKDERFYFYNREKLPKGASHCRNIGLSYAKGEYCIFLDSDDLLLPYCLEQRIALVTDLDEPFFIFPMFSQGFGEELITKRIPQRTSHLSDFLSARIHWGIMCTFWKTDFIKSIGGFNIFYPRLNDPEIHIRAMLASNDNYRVFYEAKPDSIHRWTIDMMDKENFTSKYAASLELFFDDIPALLRANSRAEFIPLIKAYLKDCITASRPIKSKDRLRKLNWKAYRNEILNFFEFIKFGIILK